MAEDPNTKVNLSGMRKQYTVATGEQQDFFDVSDLVAKEPFANFRQWLEIACKTSSIIEPNAMSLATASRDGKPSVRMVLLKGFDSSGFKFYTNYKSRKGQELEENPHASLMLYWTNAASKEKVWSRQVRIDGTVEKLSEEESAAYFSQRPRSSQISACVSDQSKVIPSKQCLINQQEELENKYRDESVAVPKPSHWGGYVVKPHQIEFWQGHGARLHDRIVFRRPEPGEKIDPETTHQGTDGWASPKVDSDEGGWGDKDWGETLPRDDHFDGLVL